MAETKLSKAQRFLTFTLDKELYALDIYSVREILDMTEITRIPQAPPFMRGVVNLRGNAVPVMDLRQRFNLEPTANTVNTRIIIIELSEGNDILLMGALADSVKEVIELDAGNMDPPPRMGSKIGTEFITGIGKQNGKFVILLDVGKVFATESLRHAANLADGILEEINKNETVT
ncbi:MAG: chemotaxis protein CheW [Magnetococcales bacterium]|nr:chemotaxis protein CheW [Magnetococcales bacterium]NGZ26895.1 chemotaxis protein CheW [Magnetococcales bacterium]